MKFARAFFKHPKVIIAACIAITAVLGFFIKDLSLDNAIRQFFPRKDVSYERLTTTEDMFGSMLVIGVSLETPGNSILTPEYIEIVRSITDQALEIPEVEDVDSLTHIDYVCDQDGSISATQLIPDTYTGSAEDIEQLKGRLAEWSEMYNRVIMNDNNTGTQLQVILRTKSDEQIASEDAGQALAIAQKQLQDAKAEEKSSEEIEEAAAAVKEAKAAYRAARKAEINGPTESDRQMKVLSQIRAITEEACAGHNINYKLFGEPSLSENSKSFMVSDLIRLIPLVVIVVLVSLFMSFKTIDGTLLPLVTVLMSTIWTCGLMALLHVTFTLVSSVIPVALIAVGSAYGIHVLSHYYVAVNDVKGELTKETYDEAIFKGLREVMLAVLLAGITTVVGFISLISSPIEPLHSFAIFTAIGVAFSLILSITFIPAILFLKPYKSVKQRTHLERLTDSMRQKIDLAYQRRGGKSVEEAGGDTLYTIFRFFCGTRVRLAIFIVLIIAVSIAGFRTLKIDTALINYFPKTSNFRKDIDYVDTQFAGTNSVYINITGPESGSLTNPDILKAVDDMEKYLADNHYGIGKIVSFTTFIKRINQVWHVPGKETQTSFAASSGGESVDSWGDDSFSSWGDDDSLDSFADSGDNFDSWGSEETAASVRSDFVDPNIAYKEQLEATLTTQQILDMLSNAYQEAGGKYATVEDIVDILEKQVNYNGRAYHEVPYDESKYPVASHEDLSGVVQGYLTLLSGSLGRFIDDDMNPQIMRVQCQLRVHTTDEVGDIIADARAFAERHFPEGYTVEFTGSGEMEYAMTNMIVTSQLSSLLLSLLSVFIIIAISFKSGWAGLLGAVPLALTILLNYMVMGFAHINLDLVTSIIASVAVGVGIDYTIHFLSTYREERSHSRDIVEVTKQTFRKTGHGISTNALAVGLGFLVLCFSKFTVLRYIGVLVAIVMFTSSLLAMTVIPGFLSLHDPKFVRPKNEPELEVVADEQE